MSPLADDQNATLRPKRLVMALVLAAGLALGSLPFLMFRHLAWIAGGLFVFGVLLTLWRLRGFATNATEAPGTMEWLIAGWAAVGTGGTASLIGFIWYGIAYASWWLLAWLAGLSGFDVATPPATVAAYVGVFFCGSFLFVIPFLLADTIPAKLYPPTAGGRSAFFPLAQKRWKLAVAPVMAVAAPLAILFLFDTDVYGLWPNIVLSLVFTGTGNPLSAVGSRAAPGAADEATTGISELLTRVGYSVTEAPVTGLPEVDPLISHVNLLALSGDRGYAFGVVGASSSALEGGRAKLDWSLPFDLRTGALALQGALRVAPATEGGSPHPDLIVEPLLLLIGDPPQENFLEACAEAGVRLIRRPDLEPVRSASLADLSEDQARELAERFLRVPPAGLTRADVDGAQEVGP